MSFDIVPVTILLLSILLLLLLFLMTYLNISSGVYVYNTGTREFYHKPIERHAKAHACIVSAILGGYEKTAKGKTNITDHSMFMILDEKSKESTANSSIWTPVKLNSTWWANDCYRFEGAVNNPCVNKHDSFLLAKFVKTQAHRIDVVRNSGCNVMLWVDGTLDIHYDDIMSDIEAMADEGKNFAVFMHNAKRKGTLSAEIAESHRNRHYDNQPIDYQYKFYLEDGFKERWFDEHTFVDRVGGTYKYKRDIRYGMYVTCMVLFDLRDPVTERFLDCWWEETIRRSTQDQVSFPYCAWKLGIDIPALPDGKIFSKSDTHAKNKWLTKELHGHR